MNKTAQKNFTIRKLIALLLAIVMTFPSFQVFAMTGEPSDDGMNMNYNYLHHNEDAGDTDFVETYQTDDEPMDVLDVLNTPNTQEAPYIEVMRPPNPSPSFSPTLSLSTGSWIAPATESLADIAIFTNQPLEDVTVTSSDPSWLNISGSGDIRTIHVATNSTNME